MQYGGVFLNHTEQRFDPDKDTIVPKNSRPTSAQQKEGGVRQRAAQEKQYGTDKQKNLYESFGAGETSGSIHAPAAPSEDIGGI